LFFDASSSGGALF